MNRWIIVLVAGLAGAAIAVGFVALTSSGDEAEAAATTTTVTTQPSVPTTITTVAPSTTTSERKGSTTTVDDSTTTTWVDYTTSSTQFITPPGYSAVATIGCSNTNESVWGYGKVSEQGRLVRTAQGGVETWEWAEEPKPWRKYDAMRPTSGFDAVWLNLCQRVTSGPITEELVFQVLDQVWDRDPGIPVFLSPLNFYVNEDCMSTAGNLISNSGGVLADQMAADHPDLHRGPDLGPLGNDMLEADACHPTRDGSRFLGGQLVGFFDD